ncbi:MFS transporter [Ruficoccus amylovorans]|uniref:MFS transporter n=1 Tax=Ruficoccus amylovorans TaxID=1804625 RepID=A0A842HCB9_9BACT|nr:MFS transporter [Ruficoccus amylovorans]MBC2593900.1 MFS transporter [Ruficoccus amylovorans]
MSQPKPENTQPSTQAATEATEAHVPLGKKLGYASGALADNLIMNGFSTLVLPVYNIGLFVNPVLLGWAMAIPRFFDALTDPIMGNLSDNTRTRWGRRRPYIVAGILATVLLLPLLWLSPSTEDWSVFWWLTVFGVLYFLAYTVFIIPYQALGFEMTTDYDERTRLLAWPNYFGLTASFIMPWLPRFIEYQGFGGPVKGAVWVSIGMGAVILVAGLLPAIVGREIARAEEQQKIRLLDAIKLTLKNRAFLVVVMANVVMLMGLATFVNLSLYVNIFYIYGGDRAAGTALAGISGSTYAAASYLSVLLATAIATRVGKKTACLVLLSLTFIGVVSLWWTLRPSMPYLQLVSTVVIGFGLQGSWMMFFIMIGDVCEEDERENGLRREGIFSAIGGFSRKMSVAAASVFGGTLLSIISFDAEAAANGELDPAVLVHLKEAFVFGQAAVVLLGMVLLAFYPITRARAEETQAILGERKLRLNSEQLTDDYNPNELS